MPDHTLNIVVNRTRETGHWVAKVDVDPKNKKTTVIFSQRKDGFLPIRWIEELIRGQKNADSLSKEYMRALNFESDHAFGRKAGFTHIRKPITQRQIDHKFSNAAKILWVKNKITGPVGAPFASHTKDFASINVTFIDSVEQERKRNEVISAVFDGVHKLGDEIIGSSKKYYASQLDLALHVAYDIKHPDDSNESELRSAVSSVNFFIDKLKSSENKKVLDELATLKKAVENRLNLYRPAPPGLESAKVQLSPPSVYGKRPIRPANLGAVKTREVQGE